MRRRLVLIFGATVVSFMLLAKSSWCQSAPTSQWFFVGADGKLQYKILPNPDNPSTTSGDHIMDFSSAGYMGGGVGCRMSPSGKVSVHRAATILLQSKF